MPMEIRVLATPQAAEIAPLSTEDTAVVIDVLRMTSVAATALANGCAGLYAVCDIDAAHALAAEHHALLGGERQALPIEGFDLSNSPLAYSTACVSGRRLVMTTTNGTHAIQAVSAAGRVVLAAMVNLDAVVETVCSADRLVIACAGTEGAFTLEDALAAGGIISRLQTAGCRCTLDDMALAAGMLYEASRTDLHAALAQTRHYQRLKHLGMVDDLVYCLQESILQTVPERGDDGWFTATR